MSKKCKDIELLNTRWLFICIIISVFLFFILLISSTITGCVKKIIMWCSFIFLIICIIFLIINKIMFGFVEHDKLKCSK